MSEPTLAELRRRRDELQHRDDAVSYVRRVAQGRLDLVRDALARAAGSTAAATAGDVAFAADAVDDDAVDDDAVDADAVDDDAVDDDAVDDDAVDAEASTAVDPARADARHRVRSGELARELTEVLADRLLAGDVRPPRPADDFSDDPLSAELDRRCAVAGFGRLIELDADALGALAAAIEAFEQQVSTQRRDLYAELDVVTDELVERLRAIHAEGGTAAGPDAPSP